MKPRGDVSVVPAGSSDEATLWQMLVLAASMGTAGHDEIARAKADPYLRAFVEAWGSRPDDLGVIARASGARDVGAAWLRLPHPDGPFKLAEGRVPELATALLPEARALGVGTRMMNELILAARGRFPAIVLSVRESNPAVRFYSRLGFRQTDVIINRVGGSSLVMRLEL